MKKSKMKRVSFVLIAVLIGLAVVLPQAAILAKAETVYDEMDSLFKTTLSEILDYENADDTYISAEKEMLYDIELNPLGILYRFDYDNNDGYAILIHNGTPTITEITIESPSPYQQNKNTKIYITSCMYWEYDGESFYDISAGLPVSDEGYAAVYESAYKGSTELFYASEKVYYVYRSETKYNIVSIPDYVYGPQNGCAPVAGTNLICYYDKTYTNLIPNYEPGMTFLGVYMFKAENSTTTGVCDTLYTDMGTNASGTTISQFRSGMTKYINRQGYAVSYSSLMSSSNINYETAKTTVMNNKAIALFLGGFRIVSITSFDGYDYLGYEYCYSNHVAAGFGCLEVNYTFSSGSRTDKYIYSSMGIGTYNKGYINIATTTINEALAINIS